MSHGIYYDLMTNTRNSNNNELYATLTTRLKPNSITLAGSKLVLSWFETGRRPDSNLSATSFGPSSNQTA